jgi:methionine-rich copper-binding protein CopC
MKRTLRLGLGVALGLTAASAAWAHAGLWHANPAAGGIASAPPKELRLTFTEAVSGKLSGVSVTDKAGAAVKTQAAALDPKDAKTLTAAFDAPLGPGVYKVKWHAVASDDGHRTQGTYSFTVK